MLRGYLLVVRPFCLRMWTTFDIASSNGKEGREGRGGKGRRSRRGGVRGGVEGEGRGGGGMMSGSLLSNGKEGRGGGV